MSQILTKWLWYRGALQTALGLGAAGSMIFATATVPKILSPKTGLTTKEAWITFQGSADPVSMVLLYSGEEYLEKTEANEEGKWEKAVALPTGTHRMNARYEFPNGAAGEPSEPVMVTVTDLLAPLSEKLVVLGVTDGQEVRRGVWKLEGTVAPGRRVEVTIDGKTFRKAAQEDGTWSFNLYLSEGEKEIVVTTAVEPKEEVELNIVVR